MEGRLVIGLDRFRTGTDAPAPRTPDPIFAQLRQLRIAGARGLQDAAGPGTRAGDAMTGAVRHFRPGIRARQRRARAFAAQIAWALWAPATALVPHLGDEGQAEFAQYASAADHKAFAIAPGGTWGWSASEATPRGAEEAALAACQRNGPQPCVLYDSDGQRVFDAVAWPSLWAPYPSAADAARAVTGAGRGQRFPDLSFRDASGRVHELAQFRGRIVLLHLWGSWCGPCRNELSDLQRLYSSLRREPGIGFVLLQVREPVGVSRRWLAAQKIDLPLYDSGAQIGDETLMLESGSRVADRELARVFPTTYILDRHGLVLMSHVGPVPRWAEYEAFLRDAVAKSGRPAPASVPRRRDGRD